MGPTDRKVILTGMVVCGVIIVLGLATGVVGVALLGTLGVAVLALMLIWAKGPEIQFYQAAPVIGAGPRKHGGCLTWFMLVWIAFEIFGLATLSLGPLPDDLVNWGALSRYGDLPVIVHAFLLVVLPLIRIGCLIALWAWWKKWGVVGFLSAVGLDLVLEAVGRAWLGPPPVTSTSSSFVFGPADLVIFSAIVTSVFAVLVSRERGRFDR